MPSSNTPSDLKAVIVRALDAACTNAADEISNGCLNRSFANIKELPRLLFRCATFRFCPRPISPSLRKALRYPIPRDTPLGRQLQPLSLAITPALHEFLKQRTDHG
jgi:hypothetical protein